MGLRRCGRLCPPAPFAENSHRGIPCPRARCTFPSSWKSAQKSREKPRFLHFLAHYTICEIVTLLPHVRRGFSLSQRIKGLSHAAAPLPLMLCHGRSVCIYRKGGQSRPPLRRVARGACVYRAGGRGRTPPLRMCLWSAYNNGTLYIESFRRGFLRKFFISFLQLDQAGFVHFL